MGDRKSGKPNERISRLAEASKAGDVVGFAQLLTALERDGTACFAALPELLAPSHLAFRIGITGPPGAGKSTLIGQLISRFRALGHKVGVLAVDPSSPFTKGAILGDRIRYHEHFGDPGVFIRSLGSRGSLGGISAAAYLMVRAFDLAAFDIVLIETVGVGQTELDIMNVADRVSVVLVPESGDSIQGMKAGLLEIADIFIVNKSDRPGADVFARELEASLQLAPRVSGSRDGNFRPEAAILRTTAINGEGVSELVATFASDMAEDPSGGWKQRRQSGERLKAEAKALLRAQYEREINARLVGLESVTEFAKLFRA